MDRFYVKARDLAQQIRDKYGAPDVQGEGNVLVGSNKLNARGIMYLAGFWHGVSGDHIDLWDGNTLRTPGQQKVLAETDC